MIKVTQLLIDKYRPAGAEIETRPVIVNPNFIAFIGPKEYRYYKTELVPSIGSVLVFSEESGFDTITVRETVEQLWLKMKTLVQSTQI